MVPKDVGLFVGRYFQVLGVLSLASSVLALILNDRFNVNLTFLLFFWVAGYLKRHNLTARKWTLRLTGAATLGAIAIFISNSFEGLRGTHWNFLGWEIENPTLSQTAAVAGALLVLCGLPFALLLTPQAAREFGGIPVRFSLRKAFTWMTLLALFVGGITGVARLHHYQQVRRVRAVLAEYPQVDRVWIGTNDDVQLEVEEVYFTVDDQSGAIFRSGGIDYVGEAEFRRRVEQALRERREVELPGYVTPLAR
jgi:hypothetical protein